MRSYSFLVLTDHSGHSAENSIYAILTELAAHPRTHKIDAVSRGLSANRDFFTGNMEAPVYGYRIDKSFEFDQTGGQYDSSVRLNPDDYDVILMRLPRPIPDVFF